MARSAAEMFIQVSADIDDAVQDMAKLDKTLQGVAGDKTLSTTEQLKKNFEAARPAGYALAGAGAAITGSMALAAKVASDYESAFTGVIKTLDATPEQLAAIKQGIRDMAMEIPVASTELARIGELGGQLGIDPDNMLKFIDTIAALAVTTNLTIDSASTDLARFANIMGTPQTEFDRLGSTIVALGNNLATTEQDIVNMAMRIAGAGKTIGLTEAQVFGLAGALSSVGIEAQMGGTAISRVMIDIASQVATGGENLDTFAQVAGMSASQFSTAWKTDAAGALVSFIEGLGRLQAEGGNVFGVLDELDLGEIRVRDALLRAANAGDLFRTSLALGTQAWQDNTALTREAELRYATFASQLAIFKNKLLDVGITLGEVVLPVLIKLLDLATPMIQFVATLAKGFGALPQPIQMIIVAGIGLAGILMTLLGGFILLAPGIMALPGAFAALGSAVGIIGGVLGGLVAILTGPVALAIAAIVAAVAVLYMAWTNDWFGIQEVVGTVWRFLETAFAGIAGWVGDNLLPLFQALADVGIAAVSKASEALGNVWNRYLLPALTDLWNLVSGAVGPVLQWLANAVVGPLASAFWDIVSAIQSATSWLSGLAGAISALQLPEWLQPGSPTPFETGLWGIVSALRAVDGALPATSFGGIGAPLGGGLGGGGAVINGPLIGSITVAGEADEDRLVEKLRLMLEQALDISLGQSTRQPFGLEGSV